MNRREARRTVLSAVSTLLWNHLDSGEDWIQQDRHGKYLDADDIERMEYAVRELADQLLAKAERLEDPS